MGVKADASFLGFPYLITLVSCCPKGLRSFAAEQARTANDIADTARAMQPEDKMAAYEQRLHASSSQSHRF